MFNGRDGAVFGGNHRHWLLASRTKNPLPGHTEFVRRLLQESKPNIEIPNSTERQSATRHGIPWNKKWNPQWGLVIKEFSESIKIS